MHSDGQGLLRLLFNSGESICVSNNAFGFHSMAMEKALEGDIELISPNESVAPIICNSSDLIMAALNPINGFRRDNNVTKFRSFLVELDIGTIDEQLGTIRHSGMPFSAQVFSGNKSVHTLITLEADLPDEKAYRDTANWIFNIITAADRNCVNPSRSIRIPGAYRDNGKQQTLIGNLKNRICPTEFFTWLNKFPDRRPKAKEKKIVPPGQADFSRLSPWARIMLVKGIDFKDRGRNQTYYALAFDLAKAGFTEDKGIELLLERFVEERDFKEKELLTTITSAFRKVREA
jgi:hypothetical protein